MGEGAGESPAPENWAHSPKGAHTCRKACRSRGNKVAAPPLDSPCDGPVTYPGDIKTLIKSSKGRRDGETNFILRIKEQETLLNLHEYIMMMMMMMMMIM